MNHNHDNIPDKDIKVPARMPDVEWEKRMIDKEFATTQKPK